MMMSLIISGEPEKRVGLRGGPAMIKIVLFAVATAQIADAFAPGPSLPVVSMQRSAPRSGIRQSCMALKDSDVTKWLEKGEEGRASKTKVKTPILAKAMNKATKAMSVAWFPIGNKAKKETFQILGPAGFSQALRETKFNGLWVPASGDVDAIEALCGEQNGAKGNFPGPVCVVMDGVTTLQQAAVAKALGCSAVAFNIPQVGPAAAEELVNCFSGMQLESVCTVTPELVDVAVKTGADIVCVVSTGDYAEMKEARDAIPKGIVAIASITVDPETVELFEVCRKLKEESGFVGVLLTGMFKGTERDMEIAPWALEEATSKRSTSVRLKFAGVSDRSAPGGGGGSGGEDVLPAVATPALVAAPKPKAMGTPVGGDMFGLDEFTGGGDRGFDDDF